MALLRALAVDPRLPRRSRHRQIRHQPLQSPQARAEGHSISDGIAVTRTACHNCGRLHEGPRSTHTPGQAGFLREAACCAPPKPTPRSLFAASIRQGSTGWLELSSPGKACPGRHSIPGCHGGRLQSIPGTHSCTARQSTHWLLRKIFRKMSYGWITASPLISHNPRESKKQALWLLELTACRIIRAKWLSKGSSTLNVILRQGTSRFVRLSSLPAPLVLPLSPLAKLFSEH
jgi:hypothetical protein